MRTEMSSESFRGSESCTLGPCRCQAEKRGVKLESSSAGTRATVSLSLALRLRLAPLRLVPRLARRGRASLLGILAMFEARAFRGERWRFTPLAAKACFPELSKVFASVHNKPSRPADRCKHSVRFRRMPT